MYIHRFGITDQPALIEIAKDCVAQNGWETAQCIQGFGIKDERALIEIAKACAAQNGHRTAQHIQKFGIRDERGLIEIAMICAAQDGYKTAEQIQKFGIRNERDLIEIATTCAAQDGYGTAQHIQKFGISNERELIAIAKVCAAQSGMGTAERIRNFGIAEQSAVIAIAKVCAAQDGWGTVQRIHNFGITKIQPVWIEIAMICAVQNGLETAHRISEFCLGPREEERILSLCYSLGVLDKRGIHIPLPALRSDSISLLRNLSIRPPPSIEAATKALEGADEDDIKPLAVALAAQIFYLLHTNGEMPGKLRQALSEVCQYRNEQIAAQLLKIFFDNFCFAPNYQKKISAYSECCDAAYMRLPLLPFLHWATAEGELEISKRGLAGLGLRDSFKDARTGLMQTWLLTALELNKTSLSPARKMALFQALCAAVTREPDKVKKISALKTGLSSIVAIISLGQSVRLDKDFSADTMLRDLDRCIQVSLRHCGYVDFNWEVPDFSQRYLNTWGSTRVPNAWLIYANSLQMSRESALWRVFGNMIRSVIDGTYLEKRYDPANSPHLAQLARDHRPLFTAWQAPIAASPLEKTATAATGFSFRNFLKEKFGDGHFTGADSAFPNLLKFLENHYEGPFTDLEQICVNLCRHRGSPQELLPLLQSLQKALTEIPYVEFHKDIDDLISSLTKRDKGAALVIVDTDDWQDMFLSGTEVLGSCQRIDGDPNRNKCLLAYVMDGKNRMVAIKEKESGKIMARALFRLLLDDEGKPVLFLDPIYATLYSSGHKAALLNYAIERAKALGCPLLTQEDSSTLPSLERLDPLVRILRSL